MSQAGPLAERAVTAFLKTDEGRRALQLAVAAKFMQTGAGEGGRLLAGQVRAVCGPQLDAALAKVRSEVDELVVKMRGMTPDALKDIRVAIDAKLAEAKETAIAQQARSISDHVIDGVTMTLSALGQSASDLGFTKAIEWGIGRFVDNGEMVQQAVSTGRQAVTSSSVFQSAASTLSTARTVQGAVQQGIESVDAIVDTVEQGVLSVVPEQVKEAGSYASEKFGGVLSADAAHKIRPGTRGAFKRAGGYLGEKVVGTGDSLGAAEGTLKDAVTKGGAQAQAGAEKAVEKASSWAPSAATLASVGQLMYALANSEKGKEVESAGETLSTMAVGAGGAAGGAAAAAAVATAAAGVITAPAWLPALAAGAGAYMATQSSAGKVAKDLGGKAVRAATQLPVAGIPLQKGIEGLSWIGAKVGLFGRKLLPEKLGGSEKEIKESQKNADEKWEEMTSGISLKNLMYGANSDVFNGVLQTIKSRIGRTRTVVVDVSDNGRATQDVVKAAIVRAYTSIGERAAREEIAAIQVTGRGFQLKLTPDNIAWQGEPDGDSAGK